MGLDSESVWQAISGQILQYLAWVFLCKTKKWMRKKDLREMEMSQKCTQSQGEVEWLVRTMVRTRERSILDGS